MDDIQQFPIRIPRATLKALRLYALEKDTKLQAIGLEALRMWAEKHGVDLPSLPPTPDNSSDAPLTGTESHPRMSNAIRV